MKSKLLLPLARRSVVRPTTFIAATMLLLLSCGASRPAAAQGEKTAATMWWVVFNNPEFCATSPCGLDDLGNEDVAPSVVHATGQISGRNGSLQLVASLYETAEGFGDLDTNTSLIGGPGLADSKKAEIHLVVRSHGAPIPGIVDEQLTVFVDPGCQDVGGPNVCEDLQFAIHQAGPDISTSEVFWFADGQPVDGARSELIRLDGGVKALVVTSLAAED